MDLLLILAHAPRLVACVHFVGPGIYTASHAEEESGMRSSEDTLWMSELRFEQERVADYAVDNFIDGPAVCCADGGKFDI